MNRQEIESWATAYIDAQSVHLQRPAEHPNWWAIERAMPATRGASPTDLWHFILEVLARNPPTNVVEVLAAGPLEDFIAYFGKTEIGILENEARRNPAFKDLLGGVWQNRTSAEIWARVERARGKPW